MNAITPTRLQDNQHSAKPSEFQTALDLWQTRQDALNSAPSDVSRDREDELCDLLQAAEKSLFAKTPASISDLRALGEVIWQDPDSVPTAEMLSSLFVGLRSLDGHKPSITFNPASWLRHFERFGGGWVEVDGDVKLILPATQSDALKSLMWELETRAGLDAVKRAIGKRIKATQPRKSSWAVTLSEYQTAAAKLAEHEADRLPDNASDAMQEAEEEKTDKLATDHLEALKRLFTYPSPNAQGFRLKARLFADLKLYQWERVSEFAAILAQEAERFAA